MDFPPVFQPRDEIVAVGGEEGVEVVDKAVEVGEIEVGEIEVDEVVEGEARS